MGVVEVSFSKSSVMDLEVRKYKNIFINTVVITIIFAIVTILIVLFIVVIQIDISKSMINTVQTIHTDIGFRHIVPVKFEVFRRDIKRCHRWMVGYLFHINRMHSNMTLECFT